MNHDFEQSTGTDRSQRGAGLAEYALLLLLIALVSITALTTLGGTISAAFNTANGMF